MEFDLLVGIVGFCVMLGLVLLGTPIGYAMGLAGFFGILTLVPLGAVFSTTEGTTFWLSCSYEFAVLPFFILMGMLMESTAVVDEIFDFLNILLSRVRGGLLYAILVAATIFSACTGSTIGAAATYTKVALPKCLELGYNKHFVAGLITCSATMAVMIPPSITMVLIAVITQTSLGPLLLGGVIPGLLNALLLFVTVYVVLRVKPKLAPAPTHQKVGREMLVYASGSSLFIVGLVAFLLGGIYTGLFTPTQAGAMGAFGATIIYVIRWKKRRETVSQVLNSAVGVAGQIFIILAGSLLFARLLVLTGVTDVVVGGIASLDIPKAATVALVVLLYLVLGQFFPAAPMLVMTLPITMPLMIKLGFSPVWFGIMVVDLVELGSMTPPVALNVFTVAAASDGVLSVADVFKGSNPLLVVDFLLLLFIIFFPPLSLWLPTQAGMSVW